MTVVLTVREVRDALYQRSARDGDGARSSAFLGRLFHEVVEAVLEPSGAFELLRERDVDAKRLGAQVYRGLVGPRLAREQAALQSSAREVLVFWSATEHLLAWLCELVATARVGGVSDAELAGLLVAERAVSRTLEHPSWSAPVHLKGQLDLLLHAPSGATCVAELKTGRGSAEADLAQACLYWLLLGERGSLALVHFAPERAEVLLDEARVAPAREALLELIGALAGVRQPARGAGETASAEGGRPGRLAPDAPDAPGAPDGRDAVDARAAVDGANLVVANVATSGAPAHAKRAVTLEQSAGGASVDVRVTASASASVSAGAGVRASAPVLGVGRASMVPAAEAATSRAPRPSVPVPLSALASSLAAGGPAPELASSAAGAPTRPEGVAARGPAGASHTAAVAAWPAVRGPATTSVEAATSAHEAPVDPATAALGRRLTETFREYGVELRLDPPIVGPTFVRYGATLGRKQAITRLQQNVDNVQVRLGLKAPPMVLVERGRLVIDVQRPDRQVVPFVHVEAAIREAPEPRGGALLPIGVDLAGVLRFANLGDSVNCHLLVAGTTGSGKSEWLRFALAGLALRYSPAEVRFLLIDPKRSAFLELRGSPYLYGARGVVFPGDHDVTEVLAELVEEMESRYRRFAEVAADDLAQYVAKSGQELPRVVLVCDEYYDLIMRNKAERAAVEELISRLGSKARAAGIHLVLATQQPSRAVIRGTLDANMPARVGLRTDKAIESNMLLGQAGAEHLLGYGDLLFRDVGSPTRLQAPLTSPEERARLFAGPAHA